MMGKVTSPAEQMGVAAQIGKTVQLWEIGLEIGQKTTCGNSKDAYRLGPHSGREYLDTVCKNVVEEGMEWEARSAGDVGASIWLGGAAARPRREILGEDESWR